MPYGTRPMLVAAMSVNVANLDHGRTWSTPWVIDDPAVYVIPPRGQSLANLVGGRGGQPAGGGSRTAVNRVFDAIGRR